MQIDINLECPRSTGTLRLSSADPLAHPLIDPNYFADPQGLEVLAGGVKVMRGVIAKEPMASLVTGEVGTWKDAHTDAEIVNAIR